MTIPLPNSVQHRRAEIISRRDGITETEALELMKDWDQNTSSGPRRSALDKSHDVGPAFAVSARKPSLEDYER